MEDLFQLLKSVNKQPVTNQRDLASSMGISVGKVNALIREEEQEGYLISAKEGKKTRFKITLKGQEMLENTLLTQRETKLSLETEGSREIKTAVILAAGKRKDFDLPVSMLTLSEEGMIDRTISVLESCGIEKFYVIVGYQSEQLRKHLSAKQNVTMIENPRYKWSGTMYGLYQAKNFLKEDFLVLKSDLVFEQKAIDELLDEPNPFSAVVAAPSGHSDEAFVEFDENDHIFRITKDIHQINKVQAELVGIFKISIEVFEKMLEYFEGNQNPFLNFEYVLENLGRIYRFTGVMVDDLVWSKVETQENYQNMVNIVYPRILRKEREMKEKFAADTLLEILQIPRSDIVEISFAGGLTNTNYYVELKDKKYILRLPGRLTESMINRSNEKKNAQIASDRGINCNLVYCNEKTGVKLSEYIDNAETLNPRTVKLEENMKLTAEILKRLHTSDIVLENRFDPFEECVRYEGLFDPATTKMLDGYESLRAKVMKLPKRLSELGWDQKPCHNDLVAANLVKNGKGRLYLIDWEYSGVNDPMFDVAALFLENEFSAEDEELFFHYYFADEAVNLAPYREKILIFKIAQDFLWSLWTVVREAKGDDFGSYGQDRFNSAIDNIAAFEKLAVQRKGDLQ
ncbi:MAG: phosphotransferase [Oscillospiraceae bacterium]